jgi:hypothetical protein
MDEPTTTKTADSAGDFELGQMLGSRKAFASVAGRCSAAEAECMRRIRDRKLYLPRAADWDEFCGKFLGVSRTQANRLIRYLEEFGPGYFELAQLTHISPAQYRAIAPAVRENNIHVSGEAIALLPENSERIAAAIAELRRAAEETPALSAGGQAAALERRFDKWVEELEACSLIAMPLAERMQVQAVASKAAFALRRLELQRGW